MARTSNQKLKLLYVMDFLLHNTDADHPASTGKIIEYLEGQGFPAERKSIYDDIEALRLFGMDIELIDSKRSGGYYVASRNFELPELKLLVDSVQSSKFITHQKTTSLIRKIEKLASAYEAQLLQRQVYVANRVKTMNESIYYNVDAIHTGISRNRKIRFKYFEYTVTKERKYRKDGDYYKVSPFALTWDDENYYLVAFDSDAGIIKHYRVDKMTNISATEEPRDGMEAYKELDMAVYARKVFGMFSGEEQTVRLRFANHLVGAVLDRLGQDVMIVPDGDEHFTVSAQVVVSPQFFAWVSGFADEAKVVAPEHVAAQMREHARKVYELYQQE
ncbi:MAG: WYL domain-containing protein [Ruminococcaceae bacterium]|nr:WYL domain-containing protein [Oscillospiraceae bacterium]